MKITAARIGTIESVRTPNTALANATAAMVAAITATPPPCGVGILCDDRTFGRAIAYRASKGRNTRTSTAQATPAASGIAMMVIGVIACVSYHCLMPTAHQ